MTTKIINHDTGTSLGETDVFCEHAKYGISTGDVVQIPNSGKFRIVEKSFDFSAGRSFIPDLTLFVQQIF